MSWLVLSALIAVGLLIVAGLVRASEASLAFFPSSGEDVTPASFGAPHEALTVTTSDGERLRVWHLPRADANAHVLYFHGNGGNLSIWADVFVGLWQRGYDVLAFDYRGYGLSTGRPSEHGLYRDVDAMLTLIADRLKQRQRPIIYWGRSLGTPMAAYAASRHAPDGIVLEAGFPSMRSILETNPVMWLLSWLSSYQFPTARWMSQVRAPALVLHGDSDSIIPYRLGRRLYEGLSGPKQFVTIAGGDHNDLTPRDADAYWRAVGDFVKALPKSSTRSDVVQR